MSKSTRIIITDDELYYLDEALSYYLMSHHEFGDEVEEVRERHRHLVRVQKRLDQAQARMCIQTLGRSRMSS